MNLDKAIEIKGREGDEFLQTDPDEIEEADRLSIEALKRHRANSACFEKGVVKPLPGETKE